MKLMLVATDGTILDSTDDFTREEWDHMQIHAIAAFLTVGTLSAGDAS